MHSAITIDVDPLRCYREIHGLPARGEGDPVTDIGLPRFFELLTKHQAPGTLFVVGRDAPGSAEILKRGLRETGSELASHSFAHDYRLSLRSPKDIADDLRAANEALSAISGQPVLGFRAPGYNVTEPLLSAVLAAGMRYDSSLLPAPAYWAARAAAIALYAARGRPSRSLVGDPRQFWGSMLAYRTTPEAPWRESGGPLVEIPMSSARLALPLIGTTMPMYGGALSEALVRNRLKRSGTFVLELHAIDFVDQTDHPELRAIAGAQRDLQRPARDKIAIYDRVFGVFAAQTQTETLAAMCARA